MKRRAFDLTSGPKATEDLQQNSKKIPENLQKSYRKITAMSQKTCGLNPDK